MDERESRVSEFFRAIDRVRRAWRSVSPGEEISKSQFGTLMVIWQHGLKTEDKCSGEPGAISLSALADVMGQSAPALSQRVRGLEELGYVERVPDKNDRRVSGIRLSAEGLESLKKARAHFGDIMMQAINQLGDDRARLLTELLAQLAEALEKAADTESGEK